jgi:hypothetical protein
VTLQHQLHPVLPQSAPVVPVHVAMRSVTSLPSMRASSSFRFAQFNYESNSALTHQLLQPGGDDLRMQPPAANE